MALKKEDTRKLQKVRTVITRQELGQMIIDGDVGGLESVYVVDFGSDELYLLNESTFFADSFVSENIMFVKEMTIQNEKETQ